MPVTLTRTANKKTATTKRRPAPPTAAFKLRDRDRRDERPAGHRRTGSARGELTVTARIDGEDQGPQPQGRLGHRDRHRRSRSFPAGSSGCARTPIKPSARTTTAQRQVHAASQASAAGRYQVVVHPPRRARRALDVEHWSHPMKLSRSVALGVAAAALALPAAASAHPGVFTIEQQVAAARQRRLPHHGCRTTTLHQDDQRTHVRGRQRRLRDGLHRGHADGRPSTLTNGAPAGRGLVNYRFLPGTWRGAPTPANRSAVADVRGRADRPAGARDVHRRRVGHARRTSSPGRTTRSTTTSRGRRRRVGIGDEPAKWIALVKDATGVDLAALNTPAEFKAACETSRRDLLPADTASNITSATVRDAVAPLNDAARDARPGHDARRARSTSSRTRSACSSAKTAAEAAKVAAGRTRAGTSLPSPRAEGRHDAEAARGAAQPPAARLAERQEVRPGRRHGHRQGRHRRQGHA